MKSRLFFLFVILCALSISGKANESAVFATDSRAIDQEFADLSQLEQIVLDNNYCSLSELSKNNAAYSNYANLTMQILSPMEPPLGIPSFLWGCCLGPIGIVIAYLTSDNDKAEAKKALTGCIVGYASMGIVYVVLYFLLYNSAYYTY